MAYRFLFLICAAMAIGFAQVPTSTGRTSRVPAGGDLQAAINGAKLGDTLLLDPGGTYRGPLSLPAKEGTGWLTIRTSASDSVLGAGRVGPANATNMAKVVSSGAQVMSLESGAHHYRFVGLEITAIPGNFLQNLVAPAREARSEAEQPHDIVFDRCYIHGDAIRGARRGFAMNGRNLTVSRSYLSDFKEAGADSQALAGWNGAGPIQILDNYLEGAAENVMFGGGDPAIPGLVPSDIEIRGNTFSKNLRWDPRDRAYDGSRWTMKTLLELKNARRVLIEANVFENFRGFAIVVTPRNQSGGAPWSTVEDVTIRNNWIRRVSSVLNISGFDEYHPSRPTQRVTFEHNVAESLYADGESNPKMILLNQGPDGVTIRHNTLFTTPGLGSSFLFLANSAAKKGDVLTFTDNIVHAGTYGLIAENPSLGSSAATLLDGHYRRWTFRGNILINSQGVSVERHPQGQQWVSSQNAVGFRDAGRKDFGLAAKSRYKSTASDGRDPGADVEGLIESLNRLSSVPGPFAASP